MVRTTIHSSEGFPSTRRFDAQQVLGHGAFGTVWAVEDRQTGAPLAAKLLHHDHPRALARFKHEFRALADLHHPNLVRLYELHEHQEHWFFTMERLHGRDPLTWLRGGSPSPAPTLDETFDGSQAPPDALEFEYGRPAATAGAPDVDAVRSVFAQIAAGLQALHRAELLHRDLKPSNILVDATGHVKLLDFGLAQSLAEARPSGEGLVGTRPYVAPESWSGVSPTPAVDWFAMGVMLHEALTDHRPARDPNGTPRLDRLDLDASHASLHGLCRELLAAEPSRRPDADEVLARLGVDHGPTPVWQHGGRTNFVGRRRELQRLETLLDASRRHGSQVALLIGTSGVGKSATAREFCDRAQRDHSAVVLHGRCFAQEMLPLKALDGLVDSLARTLVEPLGDDPQIQARLGEHGHELGRVFPVLRLVPAIAHALPHPLPAELHELRHRAFEGLARVLSAVAERHPLVLLIDDLQWGDAESAERLGELLESDSGPGPLLLGTCRREEQQGSPFFRAWEQLRARLRGQGRLHSIELSALNPDDCRQLARELLHREGVRDLDVTTLVRESGGSPFFVEELVRGAGRGLRGEWNALGLADALRARIDALPKAERRLLELVAVAGPPIATSLLHKAAGLGPKTWQALDTLRAGHLVRTRQDHETLRVESYHDRIREALLERHAPQARARGHLNLARAMEAMEHHDRGQIARHLIAGGQPDRAVPHALAAGEEALDALAFERAAEQWMLALDVMTDDDPRRNALERKRVDALVHAGHGAEAAPILERLGRDDADLSSLRRASEQWLVSGHIDRGREVLQEVLAREDLPWPARPRSVLVGLLRDLPSLVRHRSGPTTGPHDPRLLAQIDTCWSAVRGLSSVDHVRGLYFVVHGMRLALQCGEPHRRARFGMFFAAQLRALGLPGADHLFARYRRDAAGSDDPVVRVYIDYLEGYVRLQRGACREAGEALNRALTGFEQECSGVGWEISIALNMLCETLSERGNMLELDELASRALRRAESLGDINGQQGAQTFLGLVALSRDRPGDARAHYDQLLDMWTAQGFHYPHFTTGLYRDLIDLYQGHPRRAWARLESLRPQLRDSGLERSPYIRAKALSHRAGCALALAAHAPSTPTAPSARSLRRIARHGARDLERLGRADGAAEAAQLRAALASAQGHTSRALEFLRRAERQFERQGALARTRLCTLRRRQLERASPRVIQQALEDVATLGVQRPDRWAAALTPGFAELPAASGSST